MNQPFLGPLAAPAALDGNRLFRVYEVPCSRGVVETMFVGMASRRDGGATARFGLDFRIEEIANHRGVGAGIGLPLARLAWMLFLPASAAAGGASKLTVADRIRCSSPAVLIAARVTSGLKDNEPRTSDFGLQARRASLTPC